MKAPDSRTVFQTSLKNSLVITLMLAAMMAGVPQHAGAGSQDALDVALAAAADYDVRDEYYQGELTPGASKIFRTTLLYRQSVRAHSGGMLRRP